MADFSYYLKREGIALRDRLRRQSLLIHVALVGVFGIFLPWWKGIDFLDPVILSAYACLGILFAAPASAQAFAESRPQSIEHAMARIAVAVIYAELLTAVILAAALTTVYTKTRPAFPPDIETLILSAIFGIAASIAMAAIAGWMTLRFSGGIARSTLRIIFLSLLVLFFFRSRWLPDVAGTGTIISLAAAAAAAIGLRRILAN